MCTIVLDLFWNALYKKKDEWVDKGQMDYYSYMVEQNGKFKIQEVIWPERCHIMTLGNYKYVTLCDKKSFASVNKNLETGPSS